MPRIPLVDDLHAVVTCSREAQPNARVWDACMHARTEGSPQLLQQLSRLELNGEVFQALCFTSTVTESTAYYMQTLFKNNSTTHNNRSQAPPELLALLPHVP
jgi:hypothetical protein